VRQHDARVRQRQPILVKKQWDNDRNSKNFPMPPVEMSPTDGDSTQISTTRFEKYKMWRTRWQEQSDSMFSSFDSAWVLQTDRQTDRQNYDSRRHKQPTTDAVSEHTGRQTSTPPTAQWQTCTQTDHSCWSDLNWSGYLQCNHLKSQPHYSQLTRQYEHKHMSVVLTYLAWWQVGHPASVHPAICISLLSSMWLN